MARFGRSFGARRAPWLVTDEPNPPIVKSRRQHGRMINPFARMRRANIALLTLLYSLPIHLLIGGFKGEWGVYCCTTDLLVIWGLAPNRKDIAE